MIKDSYGVLELCNISTADGDYGFMIGTDAIFTDINSKKWHGSTLFKVSALQSAIGGVAPSGTVGMSFFQDPNDDDIIGNLRSLGLDYIVGREISFYIQRIDSVEEFYKPVSAPKLWMRRTMRTLNFSAPGTIERSITIGFESWQEERKTARRIILNVEGHSGVIGEYNPSLEYMPNSSFVAEKLFG